MENHLWILVSIILLLIMLLGISLVYAGVVKKKNALTSMTFILLLFPFCFILWHFLLGNLVFSLNAGPDIKHEVFLIFQFLFSFIAVVLMWGSILERTKYSFILIYSIAWLIFVYSPVCYSLLNENGLLNDLVFYDFAGGFTVHLTSGVSALVLANSIGRRFDYFQLRNKFSQSMIFLGTFFIWLGWFGFNGGSSLVLNDEGINAYIVTFIAPIFSLFTWTVIDFLYTPHKVTLVGMSIAIVSGLVAITPGSGIVSIDWAIIIGACSGIICNLSHRILHKVFKVDDVLDVFSSHAIGGLTGALFVGGYLSHETLLANIKVSLIIIVYTSVVSYILVKLIGLFLNARVSNEDEVSGLDIKYHGEEVIHL